MGLEPLDRFSLQMEVVIRPARRDDLANLEWFGAFSHHRQIIHEAFELQKQGLAVMLVADAGGFPVGQAWLDLRPRAHAGGPLVWAVRVLDPFKRIGLGARLMAAVEAVARGNGCRRIELGVERANGPARAFYERLGWRVSRELSESYSYVTPDGEAVTHRLDELMMTKDLVRGA
jgi:GNAT superfamily N-acetyltransferase